jgi:hypothetical protein
MQPALLLLAIDFKFKKSVYIEFCYLHNMVN